MRSFIILAIGMLMVGGCKSASSITMTDEELANSIRIGAKAAIKLGMKYYTDGKDDETVAKVKTDALMAAQLIRDYAIPVFSGAPTEVVVRSAVDQVILYLSSQLPNHIVEALKFAVEMASTRVQLPPNPTDQLDQRIKGAILAFFDGVATGLEEFASN